MNWKDRCFLYLDNEKLFEDSGHRTRFWELLGCYGEYPFFTKGLCKCMYLSAWDEEHFAIMLETLSSMSLGRETNTDDMRLQGDTLAEAQPDAEYYVFQLSNAFLDGKPFVLPDNALLEPEQRHIIQQALKAAEVIENI
ncbi:hypothetical protein [Candidatus Merdisoma sp. JLR.KK006]|jgi:hypothetical protein|uniref:hypothetical protein n=1 Tax=Candidatus Merdisoma sp. JLR.KK006 TaxID=3112626 RepID=UPI002FF09DEE